MLNPYFAFGVPLFLLLLYVFFVIIRKKTSIHYTGFVLLLIATFMVSFSVQVLQEYWAQENNSSINQLENLQYAHQLLWLPLIFGSILAGINFFRAIKKVYSFQKDMKTRD